MITNVPKLTEETIKAYEKELSILSEELVRSYYGNKAEFYKLYVDEDLNIYLVLIRPTLIEDCFTFRLEQCICAVSEKFGIDIMHEFSNFYASKIDSTGSTIKGGIRHEFYIYAFPPTTHDFMARLGQELKTQVELTKDLYDGQMIDKEQIKVYEPYLRYPYERIDMAFAFKIADTTKPLPTNNIKRTREYKRMLEYSRMVLRRALKNINRNDRFLICSDEYEIENNTIILQRGLSMIYPFK